MALQDAVFGSCVITPLCRAFLNTREHYRLKHVAMNHADILYAGVLYSRREHCIAVMELARRWARKLTQDERLIDLIALTGLYHDVGHVALSHAMDNFLVQVGLHDHETRSTHVVHRVNERLGSILSTEEEDFVCDAIAGRVRQTGLGIPHCPSTRSLFTGRGPHRVLVSRLV
jgi:HD superfamily phosphohydrolase